MRWILMILMCTILTGCTESRIIEPRRIDDGAPNLDDFQGKLDMEQLHADVCDIIYSEDYPVIQDIYFDLNLDEERMYLDVVVKNDCEIEDALHCPVEVIKVINDCAAVQKPEYEVSSDTSYGEIFDYADIYLRLYYAKEYPDGDSVIKDMIERGNYIEYEL